MLDGGFNKRIGFLLLYFSENNMNQYIPIFFKCSDRTPLKEINTTYEGYKTKGEIRNSKNEILSY